MEISAHYITDADAQSEKRKVALRLKGLKREDQESAHITFVLDTSGSMDDHDRLASCKKSISFVLELMRDTDAASIVVFDDNAEAIVKCLSTTPENKVRLLTLVDNIITGGCTNMSAGLLEAKTLIEPAASVRKQGLVLLTDGIANLGVWDPEKLFQIVRTVVESRDGLTVNTVGYGLDHNVELLSKIADWTSGTYSVVNNLEDVATVFGSILGSMVSTTAQTVKVGLPPGYKMISKLASEATGDSIVVRVGDIQSEVSQILLLEVDATANLPMHVCGYNLIDHLPIDVSLMPGPVPMMTDEDRVSLEFAFLRIEVVSLITEIRGTLDDGRYTSTPEQKAVFLAKIVNLKLKLDSADASLASMTSVMKSDLNMLERALNGMSRHDMGFLSQHTAVYTSGRGMTSLGGAHGPASPVLGSAGSHHSSDPEDEIECAPPIDATSTPMMSTRARQYASLLRARSHNPDPSV
jgi:Mg-chelatase subunit ChlD